MNETVKEWVGRVLGPSAAEIVPEDMTWNAFFVACTAQDGQPPLPDHSVQEKCLWRLAEILHTPIETLKAQIGKENNK